MGRSRKRAVIFSVGDESIASARVRAGTIVTQLRNRGWRCTLLPAGTLGAKLCALSHMFLRKDLVVIQKITPSSLAAVVMMARAKRVVFELDDAIYFGYPGEEPTEAVERRKRLSTMLKKVDLVVVSNNLMATDLRELGDFSAPIKVFPGPAPELPDLLKGANSADPSTQPSLIWLGSPSTFPLVEPHISRLREAAEQSDLELVLVGGPRVDSGPHFRSVLWTQTCADVELQKALVGVMPMTWDEWTLRKAAYKILEYLAYGVIPLAEASDAITTLLGEERHLLGVFYDRSEHLDWPDLVAKAMRIDMSDEWREARSRVFERWSAARFAQEFLAVGSRK